MKWAIGLLSVLVTATITQADHQPLQHVFGDIKSLYASIARPKHYVDHKVVRLLNPPRHVLADITAQGLDVWGGSGEYVDVHVTPKQYALLKAMKDVVMTVLEENVQEMVDEETEIITSTHASRAEKGWFEEYHRYDEIVEWYQNLAKGFPDLLTFIPSIGKTVEGRDIIALRLTSQRESLAPKPQIYFQGQIHAREWISGATVQYIVNNFTHSYGQDGNVTKLLDTYEYIIVPVVNPDGFEYTWTDQRLWRKNRRQNDRRTHGVDLNRNFNDHWNLRDGASDRPSAEDYRGPAANSEPETQSISKFFLSNKRIIGAIDFHSYSQLLLRPLGWSREEAEHEAEHKAVGDAMRDIMASVHGKSYTSMPSVGLYPTSGAASDWFYGDEVANTMGHHVYSFTIELRPKNAFGGRGFILNPREIIPVGEEILPAFMYFSEFVGAHPLN